MVVQVHVEGEAVVLGGGPQHLHVADGERGVPAEHGAIGDTALLVEETVDVRAEDDAEAGAGGTRAGGLVEREVAHDHLGHRGVAVGTRDGPAGFGVVLGGAGRRVVVPGLLPRQVVRRRDVPPTSRARAVAEAGPQHPQVGEDLGDRAHGRTRAAVRQRPAGTPVEG
jgi:hypothetical protein